MERYFIESLEMYAKMYIFLFLVILVFLSYLYTGKKFGLTIGGFFLGIFSIFYSPFLYLRKKFDLICLFGEQREKSFKGVPHYLLRKAILFLQIILVAGTVAVITNALIVGYETMLPPQWLRDRITQTESILDAIDSTFSATGDKLEKFDDEWASNKELAMSEYKKKIDADVKTLQNEYREIDGRFSGLDETQMQYVRFVRDSLGKPAARADQMAVERTVNSLKNYLSYGYYLDYSVNSVLRDLIDKWAEVRKKQFESTNLTEEQVRYFTQPEYAELKTSLTSLEEYKSQYTAELAELKKQAEYNFSGMFEVWLYHILVFIVFIWLFGLIIEGLNLSIQIGTDVSRLRVLKEPASEEKPVE